jgi:hypothetical protein
VEKELEASAVFTFERILCLIPKNDFLSCTGMLSQCSFFRFCLIPISKHSKGCDSGELLYADELNINLLTPQLGLAFRLVCGHFAAAFPTNLLKPTYWYAHNTMLFSKETML